MLHAPEPFTLKRLLIGRATRGAMKYRYETPRLYEAYMSGARDLFESLQPQLTAPAIRALDAWFSELESWQGLGDPPQPPSAWPRS